MNEILQKITRYNLFNYLLPGVIFIIFTSQTTGFDLIEMLNNNTITILFLAYFIGTIISRLGSLFIEPAHKKVNFIKFAKYSDYLEVAVIDKKLDDLSEENNVYRTYISLFLVILIINLVLFLIDYYSVVVENIGVYISLLLLVLFLFSYRKQTRYVTKRIAKKLNKDV